MMPVRLAALLAPLALVACGVAGWEEPARAMRTLCDDAGSRTNIGPDTRLDARPRPECRPGRPERQP